MALVCDLCGGKISMGAGGVGRCEVCGMEYSSERLREMLQAGGTTPAAPAAPAAPVDNSQTISNFLTLVYNAIEADNEAEAEQYCNKIIELDPMHYEAWFLKGKAAGWQSTIKNPRLAESVAAFAKAISYAPEDKKEGVIEESKDQIRRLCRALISLRGDRFAKWPDEEEKDGMKSDLTKVLTIMGDFVKQTGVPLDLKQFLAPLAVEVNQCVVKAFQEKIEKDYKGENNRPSDNDLKRYLDRLGYAIDLLELAVTLVDEDDESNVQRYENIIFLHQKAIDSQSWDWHYSGGTKYYTASKSLTDAAKKLRRADIAKYQAKVDAIKGKKEAEERRQAEERKNAYWAEHADEKAALEAEQAKLIQEMGALNAELKQKLEETKGPIDAASAEIKAMEAKRDGLGLFKGKEKKALNDQIEAKRMEVKGLLGQREKLLKGLEEQVKTRKARVDEIDRELTRDR